VTGHIALGALERKRPLWTYDFSQRLKHCAFTNFGYQPRYFIDPKIDGGPGRTRTFSSDPTSRASLTRRNLNSWTARLGRPFTEDVGDRGRERWSHSRKAVALAAQLSFPRMSEATSSPSSRTSADERSVGQPAHRVHARSSPSSGPGLGLEQSSSDRRSETPCGIDFGSGV